MSRPPEVEQWLAERDDEQRARVEELAALVTGAADLDQAVRWKRLTFTANGDWHHWLCAVAASAKGVHLLFHKGVLLADPENLLRGDGKYTRQVDHASAVAAPDAVAALVREAVAHQRDMLD